MSDWFLRTRTEPRRYFTWPARLLILALLIILLPFGQPILVSLVNSYIIDADPPLNAEHLVVENWNGGVEPFVLTREVASRYENPTVATIIYENDFQDLRKRQVFKLSAWAAGLDSGQLILIPVPKTEPKTLNIAYAVLDFAARKSWRHVTVVTHQLHSARSKKAYQIASQQHGIQTDLIGVAYENVSADTWQRSAIGWASAFSECVKKIYYDTKVW